MKNCFLVKKDESAGNAFFTYLFSVAYDGSDFAGWAKQPNKFTVQGYIESVIQRVFQRKISILATSRTDKGVHACQQRFTLRLNHDFSEEKVLSILRKSLVKYIWVKKAQKMTNDFHPLRQVQSKEYRYFINTGRYDILQKKYRWEYNLPIEVKKLNAILQTFLGEHDFFNYSGCSYREKREFNTVRTITALKSWKRGNIVIIKIVSRGFLRYQIRAMIGEVINCYEGKQSISDLQQKLDFPSVLRLKYRNIALASGLYLWKVEFNKHGFKKLHKQLISKNINSHEKQHS